MEKLWARTLWKSSWLIDRHMFCLTQQKFPCPALTAVKVSIAVPHINCQGMTSSRGLIKVPTMLLYQASSACANSFPFAAFNYTDALKCVDPSVQYVFQPNQWSPRRIVARCRTQDKRVCIRAHRERSRIRTWRCLKSSFREEGHDH